MSLRLCAAAMALVFMACIVSAGSAQARSHHHAYRHAGTIHHHRGAARVHGRHPRSICLLCDNRSERRGGGLVTLHTSSGKPFLVAQTAAHAFAGFVGALEREGYRIAFIGGYRRHGSVVGSLHPRGLAIDINQTGRNRVTRRFPSGVTALAARFGLLHGAVWDHPDTGHFEMAGMSGRRYARLHRHRHAYARM